MTIVWYILAGIIGMFALLQIMIAVKSRLQKNKPAPQLQGHYGEALKENAAALFYFYSPGCRACGPMTPLVEQMRKDNPRVFKIDVSREMGVAKSFGIMATPSTILVKDGIIKEFLLGPQSQSTLSSLI